MYKGFEGAPIKILTERYEETIGSEVLDMKRYFERAKRKDDWDWKTIALYTLGNLCCTAIIGYYLLFD